MNALLVTVIVAKGKGKKIKTVLCCYASPSSIFVMNHFRIRNVSQQVGQVFRVTTKGRQQYFKGGQLGVMHIFHLVFLISCRSYSGSSGARSIHCCSQCRCSHLFCSCQDSKLELPLDLLTLKRPGCAVLSLMF